MCLCYFFYTHTTLTVTVALTPETLWRTKPASGFGCLLMSQSTCRRECKLSLDVLLMWMRPISNEGGVILPCMTSLNTWISCSPAAAADRSFFRGCTRLRQLCESDALFLVLFILIFWHLSGGHFLLLLWGDSIIFSAKTAVMSRTELPATKSQYMAANL